MKNKSKFIPKYVHLIKRKKKFTLKLFTRLSGRFPLYFNAWKVFGRTLLGLNYDLIENQSRKWRYKWNVIEILPVSRGYGKQVPSKMVIKSWIHKQSNALQFPRPLSLLSGTAKINILITIWWIPHWNGQQQKSVE